MRLHGILELPMFMARPTFNIYLPFSSTLLFVVTTGTVNRACDLYSVSRGFKPYKKAVVVSWSKKLYPHYWLVPGTGSSVIWQSNWHKARALYCQISLLVQWRQTYIRLAYYLLTKFRVYSVSVYYLLSAQYICHEEYTNEF